MALLCRVLGVCRSGDYAARRRGPGKRETARERLRLHVRAAFRKSRRRYGSPRVHQELRAQGIRTGKRQVERLMREEGLRARPQRPFVRTTDSAHAQAVAPAKRASARSSNILERTFSVDEVPGVDRVWVGDLTNLPTRAGWLYLAVVLDLKSRAVVGWQTQNTREASLATGALAQALWRRRPERGLLHHSDRGVQYTSAEYQGMLHQHGIRCSMSRKGNCWGNAVAESFFATLEKELVQGADWRTHE